MKNWLDKYEEGGFLGTTNKPFNYNGAWGGTMQKGGRIIGQDPFAYPNRNVNESTKLPAPAPQKTKTPDELAYEEYLKSPIPVKKPFKEWKEFRDSLPKPKQTSLKKTVEKTPQEQVKAKQLEQDLVDQNNGFYFNGLGELRYEAPFWQNKHLNKLADNIVMPMLEGAAIVDGAAALKNLTELGLKKLSTNIAKKATTNPEFLGLPKLNTNDFQAATNYYTRPQVIHTTIAPNYGEFSNFGPFADISKLPDELMPYEYTKIPLTKQEEVYNSFFNDDKTRYLPKQEMGGSIPGATGFTYGRTGSTPSNGKYAKKTLPSAQNGQEISYYQNGLDWKPKSISKNGSEIIKLDQLTNWTNYNTPQPGGWLDKYK